MQDISNTDGRTVLFVSHDMGAVKNLCTRLLVLENGKVKFIGSVEEGVSNYLYKASNFIADSFEKNGIKIVSAAIGENKMSQSIIEVFKPLNINISINFTEDIPSDFKIELFFNDMFGQSISTISSWLNSIVITPQKKTLSIQINLPNGLSFKEGNYTVLVRTHTSLTTDFNDVLGFNLINSLYTGYKFPMKPIHGKVYVPNNWSLN
tara:strand:- start:2012 stop:2632 length:621 start_codon:yes stop_codon:yes gene_type:complete